MAGGRTLLLFVLSGVTVSDKLCEKFTEEFRIMNLHNLRRNLAILFKIVDQSFS